MTGIEHSAGGGGRTFLLALLIPALAGLFLLISSSMYLSPTLDILDAKRLVQLGLMLTMVLISLLDPGIRNAFSLQLARIPVAMVLGLLLFFSLGILSGLVNASSALALAYSLLEVFSILLMLMTAFIMAACRSLAGIHFDRLAIAMVTMLGLAVGFQELVGVSVAWSTGHQFSYDIALTHFAHPRFYNQLQSWTIPLIVALPILFSRSRLAGLVCVLALGLHWYILLMTGSRGSTLSLVCAFTVVLVFSPLIRKTLFKWQSAGVLLGVAIYSLMFLGPESGWTPPTASTDVTVMSRNAVDASNQASESDDSGRRAVDEPNTYFDLSIGRPMMHSSGRLSLWRDALQYAKEKPILGIGPMNYACQGPTGRVAHPHNFALQIVSEWGLPALLTLLILLVASMQRLVAALRKPYDQDSTTLRKLQIILTTAVLAAGLHAGLSGVFVTPASQMMAALVTGWLFGSFAAGKPLSAKTGRPVVSMGLLTLLLAAGIAGSPLVYHEVKSMPDYRSQLPLIERALPRFWQLGKACQLHTEVAVK